MSAQRQCKPWVLSCAFDLCVGLGGANLVFPARAVGMLDMALSPCRPWYLCIADHRLSCLSVRNLELAVERCSEGPGGSQVPCTEERAKPRENWERDC